MSADIVFDGCRATPIGSYLAGLGLLRVMAEQFDPGVTSRWAADRLVLGTDRTLDELVGFLLDDYRPTPFVSPWNGGSGFHPKDKADGIVALADSTQPRFAPYRQAIATARRLVADPQWERIDKDEQVLWCRNELPDEAVAWLDAAVVLADDTPRFPPLLGTGGNVGRLEFSNNVMQRLAEVARLGTGRKAPTREDSEAWLRAVLTGVTLRPLVKGAVGQFDPGAAGGTAAPVGGPEASLVNPWGFVLAFEGSLLFASGAARRMGADTGPLAPRRAAMPFTFDASPLGYGSAATGEASKGELWAPLWSRPARYSEVARLIGEGRIEWSGRQARRGVDAARAVATLGADRGIDRFVRHAFVERMGQAMLAVPVGRVDVGDGEDRGVGLLADVDDWLASVRRAGNLPASASSLLRAVDAALLDAALRPSPDALLTVLGAVAALEGAVARSREVRRQVTTPIGHATVRHTGTPPTPLAADRWLPHIGAADSTEFRLALALASGRDTAPAGGGQTAGTLLRGVRWSEAGRRLDWASDGTAVVGGLGTAPLPQVLAGLVRRRAIDAPAGTGPPTGIDTAFERYAALAPGADVAAFAAGEVDDDLLADLLRGLLLLRFDAGTPGTAGHGTAADGAGTPGATSGGDGEPADDPAAERHAPAAMALLLPFFHRKALRVGRDGDVVRLRPASSWPALLATGRIEDVVIDALHRLRVAGLQPLVGDARAIATGLTGCARPTSGLAGLAARPGTGHGGGRGAAPRRRDAGLRLLAACAFPLSRRDAEHLVRQVAVAPERLQRNPRSVP